MNENIIVTLDEYIQESFQDNELYRKYIKHILDRHSTKLRVHNFNLDKGIELEINNLCAHARVNGYTDWRSIVIKDTYSVYFICNMIVHDYYLNKDRYNFMFLHSFDDDNLIYNIELMPVLVDGYCIKWELIDDNENFLSNE